MAKAAASKKITKKEVENKRAAKLNKDLDFEEKEIEIIGAKLIDNLCNYDYKFLTGQSEGDVINRKGANEVHKDLIKGFEKLTIFLAIIDDAFTHTEDVDTKSVSKLRKNDITDLYKATGFKITGSSEKESVQLFGSKWVKVGGHITLVTPKIAVDGPFTFAHELKDTLIQCKSRVEDYMNGLHAPQFEQTGLDFPEDINMAGAEVTE